MVGLAVLGIGALWVYSKRENIAAAVDKLNPASDQNVIYQSDLVQNTVGHELDNGYTVADHYFAYVDLINPWNESDAFAREVWGLN